MGALVVLVALQLSAAGWYLPPVAAEEVSSPNDHFAAGPDCRVIASGKGRVDPAGGDPTIGARIVFPASVPRAPVIKHIHPKRSFHCRSRLPCDRIGQAARWSSWWLPNYSCSDCICRRY